MSEQPENQPHVPAEQPQQPAAPQEHQGQPQPGYQQPQQGYQPQPGYQEPQQPGQYQAQPGYQQPQQPGQYQAQPGQYQAQPGYQQPQQPGQYQQQAGQYQGQPGYQQPQPGQYQPGQAPAPAPSSPAPENSVGTLLSKWMTAFTQIYSGKTDQAEATIATNDKGEREYPFWAVAAGVSAVVYIIMMLLSVLILDARLNGYYALSGSVLRAFLTPILTVAALMAARALIAKTIFGMNKQQISFQESANIIAIGFVAMTPYSLVLLIDSMSPNELTSAVSIGAKVFFLLLAELLIFKSLTKRGNFSKPVLLPYVGMTAGLIAVLQLLQSLTSGSGYYIGMF